ncbi:hypothetical protein DDJ47_18560 [Mycobacteroides abscessus]|nr:hypothetical protein DDJ47_18560 [Mycobacteroides abscessus]
MAWHPDRTTLRGGTPVDFETREDEQEYEWDGRRAAMSRLLLARGHHQAAGIVHASQYRAAYADGGTYTVTLSIPAEFYDYARGELHDVIHEACIDIVGADAFSDLLLRVRTPSDSDQTELERVLLASLNNRWVPSERVTIDAIPAGPA